MSGRVLAVDYGTKNIGLALSDEACLTAQPLPSIPHSGLNNVLDRLLEVVHRLDIRAIVVGMPLNMDGTRGDAALRMENVISFLKKRAGVPVFHVDETLSTIEALEYWRRMTIRQRRKYRTVDSLAAALILERHLKEY
ncbi:MAG TPA: Holliday junction resolvase RuvX [Acidobacteriota bacterium]|nr:Holliday junction resolvase RuvX [Acidobacteriota bacterium]